VKKVGATVLQKRVKRKWENREKEMKGEKRRRIREKCSEETSHTLFRLSSIKGFAALMIFERKTFFEKLASLFFFISLLFISFLFISFLFALFFPFSCSFFPFSLLFFIYTVAPARHEY
jgi:hypothetical protein